LARITWRPIDYTERLRQVHAENRYPMVIRLRKISGAAKKTAAKAKIVSLAGDQLHAPVERCCHAACMR